MTTLSPLALTAIGTAFADASNHPLTAEGIRQMQTTEQGSEILRMIVRDGLPGAEVIVAALWFD